MIETVQRLWRAEHMTLIFIEHDMDIVFKCRADDPRAELRRVLAEGTPDEVRRNPAVIEAYLGAQCEAERRHERPRDLRGEGIDVFYGSSQILFGVSSRRERGPDHGAAGPQRRRQVARR